MSVCVIIWAQCECLYIISWQSIEYLFRYFSLDQSCSTFIYHILWWQFSCINRWQITLNFPSQTTVTGNFVLRYFINFLQFLFFHQGFVFHFQHALTSRILYCNALLFSAFNIRYFPFTEALHAYINWTAANGSAWFHTYVKQMQILRSSCCSWVRSL